MFCCKFALPAGTVPVVLNVDVPDRALMGSFQAAGAALAGHRPRHQRSPHRRRAHARPVPLAVISPDFPLELTGFISGTH